MVAAALSRMKPAMWRALVLWLLLVVMQWGALWHTLGHLSAADGQAGLPEAACVWCAAYAQSGSALPATPAAPARVTAFAIHDCALPDAPVCPVVFLAYLSQAPPQFS